MEDWSRWIDRTETREDRIDPALLKRWCATLDRAEPDAGFVPQGLHWCLCLPDAPTSGLGEDGHPLRDDNPESFLPPLPLPRRMWAGSKVEFIAPLNTGQAITRISRVRSVTPKQGSTGLLVFVEVDHETLGDGTLAVRETQSLVYREASPSGLPLVPPAPRDDAVFDPTNWKQARSLIPSEPLLFRYSALTFNSHRIHYDLPYATGVEGYRGLVVHGPLTATLLLDLAQREFGDGALTTFAFRGNSPAICGEQLNLAMRRTETGDFELGAFASDGRQIMTASATRKA